MASCSMAASFPSGSGHFIRRTGFSRSLKTKSCQNKQMVCSVYTQVRLTQPGLSIVSTVSQLAGVSECIVAQLKVEALSAILKSPKCKRLHLATGRPPKVSKKTEVQRYDTFTLAATWRHWMPLPPLSADAIQCDPNGIWLCIVHGIIYQISPSSPAKVLACVLAANEA